LLDANATGGLKVKTKLIYHARNPRALKGCSKGHLPVIWISSLKAWVTAAIFEDWFTS
jgi:hypothetical protein